MTDRLSGAVALRYEDYDEFGDTTDWKVSGRYQFTDAFAIRATANTGFRAPTPGQVNTLNVDDHVRLERQPGPERHVSRRTTRSPSRSARCRSNPEESESYTVGLVWDAADRTQRHARLLPHRDR